MAPRRSKLSVCTGCVTMTLKGHPDWHRPQRLADRLLFAVYESAGEFLAPPSGLPVAEDAEKIPEFRLNLYHQDRGVSGLSTFGLLTARFRLDYDLAATRQALLATPSLHSINPMDTEEGWLRFSTPAASALPEVLRTPSPLDPSGANLALHLRLNGSDADLFLEILRRGLSTLFVEALLIRRGVAPRVANVASFDPSALRTALWGNEESAPVEALRDALVAQISRLPIRFSTAVTAGEEKETAQALLDRFAARFGTLELPRSSASSGPFLRVPTATVPNSEVRFDLAEPVLVPRGFFLTADPLGSARALSSSDLEHRLVRSIDVPALDNGQRRISVVANLPAHRIGVLRLGAEISAPPFPPNRPQTVKASAALDPGAIPKIIDMRLSPDEPLRFTWHTVAMLNAGGSAETVEGPIQTHEGGGQATLLVVSPSAFKASFVTLEAEPFFLAEARIEIRVRGWRSEQPWRAQGALDEGARELAVFVPHDVTEAELLATAVSRTDGSRISTDVLPLAPRHFDPFSFPGTGARRVRLSGSFPSGVRGMLVECAPQDRLDDPTRRHVVRLTPSVPEAEFSYVSLSPFRAGYCWRWAASGDMPAGPWSMPLSPDTPLLITASFSEDPMPDTSSLIIDGVELTPIPGETRAYSYRPVAAGIAGGPNGRKQVSLIEAGPVAMLALTAMWGVDGEALETVRGKIAKSLNLSDIGAVTLRPAQVDVGEVELRLGDGSGNFKPFLKTTSSGTPPYTAAFNAMLTMDQAPAVKKGLKGERGFLGLRYTVTEHPLRARTESSAGRETRETVFTTRTVGSDGTETVTRQADHSEARAGSQSSKPATLSEPRFYDTDAADWGLTA